MAYHGDKFFHIGAVSIVNNRDYTLHFVFEEIKMPQILNRRLLRSAVVIISKNLFLYKRHKICFKLHCVSISSKQTLTKKNKRVTPWSKRN